MYKFLRPLMFRLDAEQAHLLTSASAQMVQSISPNLVRPFFEFEHAALQQTCLDQVFPNPIGLAAGFDKNAALPQFWEALGFGFTEVGSVTHNPSSGNPRPRAFRLPEDRALINRMGLNNDGAYAVAERLSEVKPSLTRPLGINIAKTHDPDILGKAGVRDFCESFKQLAPLADYITLNISCPNTREGTTFEEPDAFRELISTVATLREDLPVHLPLLVKLSPPDTLSLDADHPVNTTVKIAQEYECDGFVATNTASDRQGLTTNKKRLAQIGNGGLSGAPLESRATALVKHLYRLTNGESPIIGVGGIDSAESAYRRIKAGASLLQIYTGLIYEGPGIVKRIKKGLVERLANDGFSSVKKAVGVEA